MDVSYDKLPDAASPIVYVREVKVADLPEEIRGQAGNLEVIYAVHRVNGERVALVANRGLAFALARQHDMAPVSVH